MKTIFLKGFPSYELLVTQQNNIWLTHLKELKLIFLLKKY
jgi:hypothetical protein